MKILKINTNKVGNTDKVILQEELVNYEGNIV